MSPNTDDIADLAKRWQAWLNCSEEIDSEQYATASQIHRDVDVLCRRDPEQAWSLLLMLLPIGSKRELTALGQPLKVLIGNHGEAFIDRVEAAARSDQRFAFALGACWPITLTPALMSRVEAVWDRPGVQRYYGGTQ